MASLWGLFDKAGYLHLGIDPFSLTDIQKIGQLGLVVMDFFHFRLMLSGVWVIVLVGAPSTSSNSLSLQAKRF